MHIAYDFVQEVLIKSQNNTEETSTLQPGSLPQVIFIIITLTRPVSWLGGF